MEKKHGLFTTILRELRRQHYTVEDPQTLLADMRSNGVGVESNVHLLTQEELISGTT